jgi:hypothetical protein
MEDVSFALGASIATTKPWLSIQPNGRPVKNADSPDIGTMIGEIPWRHGGSKPLQRWRRIGRVLLGSARKNLRFGDAVVGKKTIGGLGLGPVLTNQRNALTKAIGEQLEELSKSLTESGIAELAADQFAINPGLGLGGDGVISSSSPRSTLNRSQAPRGD